VRVRVRACVCVHACVWACAYVCVCANVSAPLTARATHTAPSHACTSLTSSWRDACLTHLGMQLVSMCWRCSVGIRRLSHVLSSEFSPPRVVLSSCYGCLNLKLRLSETRCAQSEDRGQKYGAVHIKHATEHAPSSLQALARYSAACTQWLQHSPLTSASCVSGVTRSRHSCIAPQRARSGGTLCVRACVCVGGWVWVSVGVCLCVCVRACVHVHVHVHVCMRLHLYTRFCTRLAGDDGDGGQGVSSYFNFCFSALSYELQ